MEEIPNALEADEDFDEPLLMEVMRNLTACKKVNNTQVKKCLK